MFNPIFPRTLKLELLLGAIFCFGLFSPFVQAIECLGDEGCPVQIKKLHKFARNGSPDAQVVMGALYYEGKYVAKDIHQSFIWYRRATKHMPIIEAAHHEVGLAYLTGSGTDKNVERGLKYLKKAANAGFKRSQILLGLKYIQGGDLEVDFLQARHWLRLAAENGDPMSAYILAGMLEHGLGGESDIEASKEFYLQAAAEQFADAEQKVAQFESSPKEEKTTVSTKSSKVIRSENAPQSDDHKIVIYRESMTEIEMMDLVVGRVKEMGLFNGRSTGSRLPGSYCGDGWSPCSVIKTRQGISDALRPQL